MELAGAVMVRAASAGDLNLRKLRGAFLNKNGGSMMKRSHVLSVGVSVSFLSLAVLLLLSTPAHAAWVTGPLGSQQFQVGGKLSEIVPTAAGTTFQDPTCGNQGGTSLALVSGSKVAGVDPALYPIVLIVSCLDNGSATVRSRLNVINPVLFTVGSNTFAAGRVVQQITTKINTVAAAPGNGWAHLVHRPDKG